MGLKDLFHKKTPEEMAKEWKKSLRSSIRQLDRNIRKMDMEENKVKLAIKQNAKKGETEAAKILAKQLVKSRKSKQRLFTTKAHVNSAILQIDQQLQQLRVVGALKQSSEVMRAMNDMMKIPELNETMRNLSKEMEKAGLIEEMVDDIMDDAFDDVEEEADEEVNNVLDEILTGKLNQTKVGNTELKNEIPEEEEEEDEHLEELEKRRTALRR
ncbi:hypothetical protein ABK040_011883 [Willaertia magna]